MRYIQDPGETLDDCIKKGGNAPTGAIGPKLLEFFQSIGYTAVNSTSHYQPVGNGNSDASIPQSSVPVSLATSSSSIVLSTTFGLFMSVFVVAAASFVEYI